MKGFGQSVWEGDPRAIQEAQAAYEQNPEKELRRFAMTLYSFRRDPKCAGKLMELRHELAAYANEELLPYRGLLPEDHKDLSDIADGLATYLEWISRSHAIGSLEQDRFLDLALKVCEYGISICQSHPQDVHAHTYCLLRLTEEEIYRRKNMPNAGLPLELALSCKWVRRIDDQKQLARVLRKGGMLHRDADDVFYGLWLGIRACFVRGIPMDVRKKSLAALLGYI